MGRRGVFYVIVVFCIFLMPVEAGAQPEQTARFYLGLRTVRLTEDLAQRLGLDRPEGVLVGQVYANSPADRSGLRGGDVIVGFAGRRVVSADQLAQLAETLPIGSRHPVVLIRQRQRMELEMEVGSPPAQPPQPKAPGPSRDEAWYLHGAGDFWFRIPKNWKTQGGYRNKVRDPEFDSIYSPDGQYVLICFKGFEEAADPRAALEHYVRAKLAETPIAHAWTMRVAGEPAVRVAYPTRDRQQTVYRISFCHAGRRYVINAVAPGVEEVETLPKEIAAALESLQFLRQPLDQEKLADSGRTKPPGSEPAKPTPSDLGQTPGRFTVPEEPTIPPTKPAEPSGPQEKPPVVEPPAGWTARTVGGLKVWVPPELKSVEMDDPNEARWTKETEDELIASFGVVSGAPPEQLTRWMKTPERRTIRLAGGEADVYVGGLSDSGAAGRGMMVFPRAGQPPWKGRAFCFFAIEDQWPHWEKVFLKILETIRPTESPH